MTLEAVSPVRVLTAKPRLKGSNVTLDEIRTSGQPGQVYLVCKYESESGAKVSASKYSKKHPDLLIQVVELDGGQVAIVAGTPSASSAAPATPSTPAPPAPSDTDAF